MPDMDILSSCEKHQAILNQYIFKTSSIEKNDVVIIKENHQFIWDENLSEKELTWRKQLAKKYYDKLFKEYCVCDLVKYKQNKIALRWRTEKEVFSGKGQFICAHKSCSVTDFLRTWEINFGYVEAGIKKNALVKIRLCEKCSKKLNYRHKKKEVKRNKRLHVGGKPDKELMKLQFNKDIENVKQTDESNDLINKEVTHENSIDNVQQNREIEFENYLMDLLL